MYEQRNTEARSRNHCCRGKAISITHSECAYVTLCIQHAIRMRRIVLSSMDCTSLHYLLTLSHKRHGFREGEKKRKMCLLVFSTNLAKKSHPDKNSTTYYHKCTPVFMHSTRNFCQI